MNTDVRLRLCVVAEALLTLSVSAFGAQVNALKSDSNADCFTDSTIWGEVPHSGNTYYQNGKQLKGGSSTFSGQSLTLNAIFGLSGGDTVTFENAGLILAAGTSLRNWRAGTTTVNGPVTFSAGIGQNRSSEGSYAHIESNDATTFDFTGKLTCDAGKGVRINVQAGVTIAGSPTVRFSGDTSDVLGTLYAETNAWISLGANGLANGTVYLGGSGYPTWASLSSADNWHTGVWGGLKIDAASGSTVPVKTLIERGGTVYVKAGNTLSVGTLNLNGGILSFGTDSEGVGAIRVTSSIAFGAGARVKVSFDPALALATMPPTGRYALLALDGATGALSDDAFELDASAISYDKGLPIVSLEVEDGVLYASWVKDVIDSTGSDTTNPIDTALIWDDTARMHDSAHYRLLSGHSAKGPVSDITLPAESLSIAGTYYTSSGPLNVKRIFGNGGTIQTWGGNIDVRGQGLEYNYISVVTSEVFQVNTKTIVNPYNYIMLRLDAPLSGSAELELGNYAHQTSPDAWHELTQDNSGYTGSLTVLRRGSLDSTHRTTIRFSHENALGGALASFRARALYLKGNTTLEPAKSLVLSPCNRGIDVENEVFFKLNEGIQLDVLWPITWYGRITKIGSGDLVLGGEARFQNNSISQGSGPIPEDGHNYLKIQDGAVKVSATNALDGVRIEMSGGALAFDIEPASEVVRNYGVVNVKAAVPVAPTGLTTRIPVRIDGWNEDMKSARIALFTVSNAYADEICGKISVSRPAHGISAKLSIRDNDDGTSTIEAEVGPCGLIISVW